MLRRVDRFDERGDQLWERFHPQFQLARQRGSAWLNWRYLDPRAGRIAVIGAFEDDDLVGYVAFRDRRPQATILDLVVDPAQPDVGITLMNQIVGETSARGASSVLCVLPPGHPSEASLRATGFVPTRESRTLHFGRTRHAHVPEIIEVAEDVTASIHVMLGEFDHT
jgi:hypothetical protein